MFNDILKKKSVWASLIIFIVLLCLPPVIPRFYTYILTVIFVTSLFAMSLNMLVGHGGLYQFHHAAFYGVGAYVAALMALKLGSPFVINIICAVIISGLLGGLVGIPSLRIKDHYFVIATFAFQVIAFSILNNL